MFFSILNILNLKSYILNLRGNTIGTNSLLQTSENISAALKDDAKREGVRLPRRFILILVKLFGRRSSVSVSATVNKRLLLRIGRPVGHRSVSL